VGKREKRRGVFLRYQPDRGKGKRERKGKIGEGAANLQKTGARNRRGKLRKVKERLIRSAGKQGKEGEKREGGKNGGPLEGGRKKGRNDGETKRRFQPCPYNGSICKKLGESREVTQEGGGSNFIFIEMGRKEEEKVGGREKGELSTIFLNPFRKEKKKKERKRPSPCRGRLPRPLENPTLCKKIPHRV